MSPIEIKTFSEPGKIKQFGKSLVLPISVLTFGRTNCVVPESHELYDVKKFSLAATSGIGEGYAMRWLEIVVIGKEASKDDLSWKMDME